jgi:hypothetical protein
MPKKVKEQTPEMTLEQAMKHCFRDEPHGKQKRKWFNNREAADTYSESLKHLWNEGLGHIYGAFQTKLYQPIMRNN